MEEAIKETQTQRKAAEIKVVPLKGKGHTIRLRRKQRLKKEPVQFSSVAQSCPTLCDPMNRSTPGLPVHHQLPEFTHTHVHRVSDAIQPSHPLSSPSPPAPNPSQHQALFHYLQFSSVQFSRSVVSDSLRAFLKNTPTYSNWNYKGQSLDYV